MSNPVIINLELRFSKLILLLQNCQTNVQNLLNILLNRQQMDSKVHAVFLLYFQLPLSMFLRKSLGDFPHKNYFQIN